MLYFQIYATKENYIFLSRTHVILFQCHVRLFKFKLTNGSNLLLLLDEACIPLSVWIFANVTTWGSDAWTHFKWNRSLSRKKAVTVLLNICIWFKTWSCSSSTRVIYLSISFILCCFCGLPPPPSPPNKCYNNCLDFAN